MIVVRMDLLSAVSPDRSKALATIVIANDGTGDAEVGNYVYAISHQSPSAAATDPSALLRDSKAAWKRGRIVNFRRRRGAASLLAACLRQAFPFA